MSLSEKIKNRSSNDPRKWSQNLNKGKCSEESSNKQDTRKCTKYNGCTVTSNTLRNLRENINYGNPSTQTTRKYVYVG